MYHKGHYELDQNTCSRRVRCLITLVTWQCSRRERHDLARFGPPGFRRHGRTQPDIDILPPWIYTVQSHSGPQDEQLAREGKLRRKNAPTKTVTSDNASKPAPPQPIYPHLRSRAPHICPVLTIAHRALQPSTPQIPPQIHKCPWKRARHTHNVLPHPPRTHRYNSSLWPRGLLPLHTLVTSMVRRRGLDCFWRGALRSVL